MTDDARTNDRPTSDSHANAPRTSDGEMTDTESIGCEEALDRLAAFLDRELEPTEAAEMERHLEACRSCFSRAEFEKRLRERIRSDLAVGTVSADFEERIRSLLRELP